MSTLRKELAQEASRKEEMENYFFLSLKEIWEREHDDVSISYEKKTDMNRQGVSEHAVVR